MNAPAWSHTLKEHGEVIHKYQDADGRNLYHFTSGLIRTYFGQDDNNTGYVIHREEELEFENVNQG